MTITDVLIVTVNVKWCKIELYDMLIAMDPHWSHVDYNIISLTRNVIFQLFFLQYKYIIYIIYVCKIITFTWIVLKNLWCTLPSTLIYVFQKLSLIVFCSIQHANSDIKGINWRPIKVGTPKFDLNTWNLNISFFS